MSKVLNILQSDGPMDAARKWYLLLEDKAGNDQILDQFEEWLATSQSHRDAFDSVVDFWSKIDSLPEIQKIRETGSDILNVESHDPEDNIVINKIQKKPETTVAFTMQKWQKWAVAATVLIIVSFAITLYSNYLPEGTYQTATGEQQVIQLADGSTVYLNTQSSFRVDFSNKTRKIYLLEGEARFDVAKDKNRPFIVETSWGDVRALGTSFNVCNNEEKIEVLVFEGTITVDHNKSRNAGIVDFSKLSQSEVLVAYGERVVFFEDNLSIVRAANDLEISQKHAWREGKLIFRDQRLSEVVREASRYTNKKIVIMDDALNDIKLSGVFDIEDFDALIHAIENAFPVKVIQFTPYITVIAEG